MVKDPNLHFDDRSSGQIRDRFRLKFKGLYTQAQLPCQTSTKSKTKQESQTDEKHEEICQSSDLNGQADEAPNGKASKKLVRPLGSNTTRETGDGQLPRKGSNHHITSTLAWEDMATKPVFHFE